MKHYKFFSPNMLTFFLMFQILLGIKCCVPGGGGNYGRRRSLRINGNRIPEGSNENSYTASGPATRLKPDNPSLVQIISTDIVFADPTYESEARRGIRSCTDSLLVLASYTKSYWKGMAVLYVTEGYIERRSDGRHNKDSLHYGGRAFDVELIKPLNKSLKVEKFKSPHLMLRVLASIAYSDAKFSYVEIHKRHLHLSCRVNRRTYRTSRCFHGDSYVRTINNSKKPLKEVKVGDKVLTMSSDGRPIYSEVIMMLHRSKDTFVEDYVRITTEHGANLLLSSYHLIFIFKKKVVTDKNEKVNRYKISSWRFTTRNFKFASETRKTSTFTQSLNLKQKILSHNRQEWKRDFKFNIHFEYSGRNVKQDINILETSQAIFAKDVKLEQTVVIYNATTREFCPSKVIRIQAHVRKKGAYAPLTMEGAIVVDDIYASCYALFPSHSISHSVFWLWRTLYSYLKYFNILLHSSSLKESSLTGEEEEYHWYANFFRTVINYLRIFSYEF